MDLLCCRYCRQTGWEPEPDASLDSPQTLLIVFASPTVSPDCSALRQLEHDFPQSQMVGCSSAGEIFAQNIYDDGIVVAVIRFANTRIRLQTMAVEAAQQSTSVGEKLAQSLLQPDLSAVFILADGLHVNGSALIEGFSSILPEHVVITGGLAADGDRFEQTWVMAQHRRLPQHVVAVGLYGQHLQISHGSRGGWDILGPTREVTLARGNVLYQLDGQPALQLYKKYLGELAEELPSSGLLFPLAIKNDEEIDGYTVRTILAVDEPAQSITFAGDIPQGGFVQLMHANFDRLIDGASAAAHKAWFERQVSGSVLSIAISCVGRRLVLNQRAEEEIEAVSECFPESVQQIGFYSYGEISPLASGRCDLHNQTMTLTLLAEKNLSGHGLVDA